MVVHNYAPKTGYDPITLKKIKEKVSLLKNQTIEARNRVKGEVSQSFRRSSKRILFMAN